MRILASIPLKLPLFALPLALLGCAPSVVVRDNYDFQQVRRVAVVPLEDHWQFAGSGKYVSAMLEKALLQMGYQMVERRRIDAILKEQAFQASGAVDPKTAKEMGRLLGVDALVIGSILLFTPEQQMSKDLEIWEETREPVYETTWRRNGGNPGGWTRKEAVAGYAVTRTISRSPQYYTSEAQVGVAVRMVDVRTGEMVWNVSGWQEGTNIQDASQDLMDGVAKSVRKAVEKKMKVARLPE